MKQVKSFSKEHKSTGRFATPEEAARAKNAGLLTMLKKVNLQVISQPASSEKTK